MNSPRRRGEQTLLPPKTLGQIERFSQFQLEQDFVPRIVQEQVRQVGAFHRYLILKRLAPGEMTPRRLKEYLSFVSFLTEVLRGRRLSESTLLGWRVTLRHYYGWLKAQGVVAEDPARRVGTKGWRWVPKWVPNPELVERLLALPDEHTYSGMRNQVVFGLAVTVGLTTAELASLTVDSLDPANHRLKVRHGWRPRAGEERWVPIEPPVEKVLKRYLAYARPALARGKQIPALFLNKDGKPASSTMVTEIFTTSCERLGIKRLNCKALRNVAALYQLRHRGRTIEDLMEIFGYRTIKHVRGYMAYLPKELRKQVDRPRYPSLMQDMDFKETDQADQFVKLEKLFVETDAREDVE